LAKAVSVAQVPRLIAKQYLKAHDQLRRFWLGDHRLFAELSPTEQWQLHDYFKPDTDWSDLELLAHREQVSKQRPSLPHQAGRALSRFHDRAAHLALLRVRRGKGSAAQKVLKHRERHLTVNPVMRPEIDAHELARAIINLAAERAKRQGVDLRPEKFRHLQDDDDDQGHTAA
jgi:hypothetical protein